MLKFVFEKNKNKQKEAGYAHYFFKNCMYHTHLPTFITASFWYVLSGMSVNLHTAYI